MKPVLLASALGAFALAASASAQQSSIVVHPAFSPRSLTVIGSDVICTLRQGGAHVVVDISDPTKPVLAPGRSFDPPFGDIFGDVAFTPRHGGRLVTGHRFGGLNLIDVSIRKRNDDLKSLSSVPTNYLHQGLRIVEHGARTLLYYSEHNAYNLLGGLRLYEIQGGNRLVNLWNDLHQGRDGNAMAIRGDRLYQIGYTGNDCRNRHLAIYDIADPLSPRRLQDVPVPVRNQYYCATDLVCGNTGGNLLAAFARDGLRVFDISRPNRVVDKVLIPPHPDLVVRGVTVVPDNDSAIAWGSRKTPDGWQEWWMVLAIQGPGSVVPIWSGPSRYSIRDIEVRDWTAYVLAHDGVRRRAILEIW